MCCVLSSPLMLLINLLGVFVAFLSLFGCFLKENKSHGIELHELTSSFRQDIKIMHNIKKRKSETFMPYL